MSSLHWHQTMTTEEARQEVQNLFTQLAAVATKTTTPEEVVSFFGLMRDLEDIATKAIEDARAKMLRLVQTLGEPIPDGKGLQLIINGQKVEARKSRDGLDVKKIQSWLLAKGETPQRALAEKVTYALAPDTEQFLRDLGADEATLKALYVDKPTWSVYRPVSITEST